MRVPVTHYLDSGYNAHEPSTGVLLVDGLGAHLRSSLEAAGVLVRPVQSGDEFDAPDSDLGDADTLRAGIAARSAR